LQLDLSPAQEAPAEALLDESDLPLDSLDLLEESAAAAFLYESLR
jgi:hypothetical protein